MRHLESIAGSVLTATGDALFPRKCPACGSFFHAPAHCRKINDQINTMDTLALPSMESDFRFLFAPFVCRDCLDNFASLDSPLCLICGRPFAATFDTDHICGQCLTKKRSFFAARSCGVYSKTLMALIHAYKYHGRIRLAKPLSVLLFQLFIGYDGFHDIDTVIPVPLHRRRLRERGFNQAFMMVMHWPDFDKSGKFKTGFCVDGTSLVRRKKTESQTGLGRDDRIKNIRGAFLVKRPEAIADKNILVVDDVYTTGSTVSECASTLMKAGAAGVWVLTLAKAIGT
ncbi:MAG: ComF family protein [Deltaproteobacteria bacterium]|nr:ComF family protein [Deltaproteobacteria bacterium]